MDGHSLSLQMAFCLCLPPAALHALCCCRTCAHLHLPLPHIAFFFCLAFLTFHFVHMYFIFICFFIAGRVFGGGRDVIPLYAFIHVSPARLPCCVSQGGSGWKDSLSLSLPICLSPTYTPYTYHVLAFIPHACHLPSVPCTFSLPLIITFLPFLFPSHFHGMLCGLGSSFCFCVCVCITFTFCLLVCNTPVALCLVLYGFGSLWHMHVRVRALCTCTCFFFLVLYLPYFYSFGHATFFPTTSPPAYLFSSPPSPTSQLVEGRTCHACSGCLLYFVQ